MTPSLRLIDGFPRTDREFLIRSLFGLFLFLITFSNKGFQSLVFVVLAVAWFTEPLDQQRKVIIRVVHLDAADGIAGSAWFGRQDTALTVILRERSGSGFNFFSFAERVA